VLIQVSTFRKIMQKSNDISMGKWKTPLEEIIQTIVSKMIVLLIINFEIMHIILNILIFTLYSFECFQSLLCRQFQTSVFVILI
jgi:hypothetical protein